MLRGRRSSTWGTRSNSTDPAVLKQAADLLKKQKPWSRPTTAGTTRTSWPPATSIYAHGYNGQLAKLVAREPRQFAYVLPKEGATIWMDSVCIPARARNVEAIYAFLDYIMEPEVNAQIVNGISYASANVPARQVHPSRDPERPGDLPARRRR